MSEKKKPIEIIPWVYFNDSDVKEIVKNLAKNASSVMDFAGTIREQFDLSLSDAMVVAKKFFNK